MSEINVRTASLQNIRDFIHTSEGQDEIAELADNLREELGSSEKWLNACEMAEGEVKNFGPETINELLNRAGRFIESTPPGHDPGHLYRDMLSGLALMNDPFVQQAAFDSDVIAGILGGSFHDIGNAVTARYEDRKRKAGHGEVGGWVANSLFEDLLGEWTRKLLVYSINAHTHYRAPLSVEEPAGYERMPYWYGIGYLDGAPYGLAPILTRFCDRLDLGGSSHYPRHLLAEADAIESEGENYTGEEFYEINKEHLNTLFIPDATNNKTLLGHVNIFVNSNFGRSVYSKDDHLFTIMIKLMVYRAEQVRHVTEIVTSPIPDLTYFDELHARSQVKGTLRRVSGSPNFERSWEALSEAWRVLEPEVQARWQAGFVYIQTSYVNWLHELFGYAQQNNEYESLAEGLVDRCL